MMDSEKFKQENDRQEGGQDISSTSHSPSHDPLGQADFSFLLVYIWAQEDLTRRKGKAADKELDHKHMPMVGQKSPKTILRFFQS